jgi:hypothetical protein
MPNNFYHKPLSLHRSAASKTKLGERSKTNASLIALVLRPVDI